MQALLVTIGGSRFLVDCGEDPQRRVALSAPNEVASAWLGVPGGPTGKLALESIGALLEFLDPSRELLSCGVRPGAHHDLAAAAGELTKKCWIHDL